MRRKNSNVLQAEHEIPRFTDAEFMTGRAVLEIFNLEQENVEKFEACRGIAYDNDRVRKNVTIVTVTLKPRPTVCPACGQQNYVVKCYEEKQIKHSILNNRPLLLNYRARRYRCQVCRRTFYERNPFVFKNQKISADTVICILMDLRKPEVTFTQIAERYNISPTSVASIFDQHVDMKRLPLPAYMDIDESYSFKTPESSYVCMFIDYETGEPIDILPSRKKEDLLAYFKKIPLSERKNVKIVGMDMYNTYREVVKEVFPNAYISADVFHVVKDMNNKADTIRIRIMKRFKSDSVEYYLLKHFNWMLFKDQNSVDRDGKLLFDPARERKYNHKLRMELNYKEILNRILEIDPELRQAIELKEKCVDFYENSTYSTAKKKLNGLIGEFENASTEEMRNFGGTLRNWRNEIVNSFIVVSHTYEVDRKDGQVVSKANMVNSGVMERRNSSVKTIKKVTNGMGNWPRFRNRVLYALRKDATFFMEPIDEPKALRWSRAKKKAEEEEEAIKTVELTDDMEDKS